MRASALVGFFSTAASSLARSSGRNWWLGAGAAAPGDLVTGATAGALVTGCRAASAGPAAHATISSARAASVDPDQRIVVSRRLGIVVLGLLPALERLAAGRPDVE